MKLAVDCLSFVWVIYSYNSVMLQLAIPAASPSYIGSVVAFVAIPETTALLVGKTIGRHNFSYFISPKKTWEGLVGQYLGVFAAIPLVYIMALVFKVDMLGFSFIEILIIGILIITVAVLGDLIESVLKRAMAVKDSSDTAIIGSGLGGLLDKFDSFGVGFIMMSIILNIVRPQNFPAL